MRRLEKQIKILAREHGAALVGLASRERLSDAPPSGDPSYLLPSAQSIISFAIPYSRKALRDFFSKMSWHSLKKPMQQKGFNLSPYTEGEESAKPNW